MKIQKSPKRNVGMFDFNKKLFLYILLCINYRAWFLIVLFLIYLYLYFIIEISTFIFVKGYGFRIVTWLFLGRFSSCLTHTRRNHTRIYRSVHTNILLLTTLLRYHFHRLVVAHPPIVRSPSRTSFLSFLPRHISTTWLFFDGGFDIDTLYPREYITGLPSNAHTNALHPQYIRWGRRVYTRLWFTISQTTFESASENARWLH